MLRSSLVKCLFHFFAHCLIAFETFSLPVPWPPLGLPSQTPGVDPGSPCWKESQTEVEAVDGGRVFAGGRTSWGDLPGDVPRDQGPGTWGSAASLPVPCPSTSTRLIRPSVCISSVCSAQGSCARAVIAWRCLGSSLPHP